MNSIPRAALYVRVSKNRHKCRSCNRSFAIDCEELTSCTHCGSSDIDRKQQPETQTMPLRQYIEARGMVLADEYVDRGQIGSKESRPELNRMMADARKRKFDVLVVARFDRFARSVKHMLAALEEFKALGIDFISISESIDTTTPMGKLVFTVLAAVAELESSLIRERSMAGQDRARAQGKRIGRPTVIIDRERVCQARARGESISAIARSSGIARATVRDILGRARKA